LEITVSARPQPQSPFKPYLRYFLVDGEDPLERLMTMPAEEFDNLPYGAVLLDVDARIVKYNRTEGEITNRDWRVMKGRQFFTELAVCGVGPHFHGRFKQACLSTTYDEIFPYVFHYQMPETSMLVRIVLDPTSDGTYKGVWVLVRRMMPEP
jgi:photoactive yellow protein